MNTAARLAISETIGGRYLKANHAGEHGLACIYLGQLIIARWRCRSCPN
jgi:demethoxyubiquinone hydroxylase (CLK1/Coq7/Cat5 family)